MAELITLILPHGAAAAPGRLPALETLLARAETSADEQLPTADSHTCPVAAYACLGEGGEPGDAYWLCAEPAHLVADQDQVYLAAYGQSLDISAAEAASLSAEFNALFGSDGWQLHVLTPEHWYLRLPQADTIRTTPAAQALGCAIGPLLPQGSGATQWHAALTEIEMLFHASAVNTRRREQGMPVISGVWLWGGGSLPERTALRWDTLHGDTAWLHGMARHGQKPWQVLAATATPLIESTGRHLAVFDTARHPLADLEQHWFAPLLQALKSGRLQQLELQLNISATTYRVSRGQLRRWWRRRQPWAHYAGPTA